MVATCGYGVLAKRRTTEGSKLERSLLPYQRMSSVDIWGGVLFEQACGFAGVRV